MLQSLQAGNEVEKPGWVRLNLSALMSDAKVNQVIDSVNRLADNATDYQDQYKVDIATAQFVPDV